MLAAVLLGNGRVLVAGADGVPNGTPSASAEAGNPATGRWTTTARMATVRYSFSATRLNNGRILAAGGCNQASCMTVTASAGIYESVARRSSAAERLTVARDHHTATHLGDGPVFVTGGFSASGA